MSSNFAITIWKEGKYYVAQCLNMDVSSFGETYEEALKNVSEAIELYLEDDQAELQAVEVPSITIATIKHPQ